jgi:4-hydroxy-tetrahydrodipicolinate synthase
VSSPHCPPPSTRTKPSTSTPCGKIVDRSIDAGVDGVVAAGSTGEVGALSSEERLLLINTVIEQANGRVPVIANTGATSTAEAIRLSQAAEKLGADVLMLITPYYEPLSLEETVTYIKDVPGPSPSRSCSTTSRPSPA